MVKLFNLTVTKPLSIIYKIEFSSARSFPDDWKKGKIFPVNIKNSEQIADNYLPVSLLPICSKIFQKPIFDSIYDFIDENNHLNNNQSGFRPSDSCIRQLIAITHNIFSAFDANLSLEVRGVFLDLSKAFDRVWHGGLLKNSKVMELTVTCLNLLNRF